jgi:PTS system nitrogen regulatory IIA component
MPIQQLISPQRVAPLISAPSKKRLLEMLSVMLSEGAPEITIDAALVSLIERENLGSTGVGEGVALPHGRLKGLTKAVGAFVTLEREVDYDALDRKPVRMAFALLVPEGANDEHLKLLRELSMVFSKKKAREHLLHAKTADELYRALSEFSPAQ